MNKKPYSAPKVIKVKLEAKQSVLATCNTTVNLTPGNGGLRPCVTVNFCFGG